MKGPVQIPFQVQLILHRVEISPSKKKEITNQYKSPLPARPAPRHML
jgi:hypothetical protein